MQTHALNNDPVEALVQLQDIFKLNPSFRMPYIGHLYGLAVKQGLVPSKPLEEEKVRMLTKKWFERRLRLQGSPLTFSLRHQLLNQLENQGSGVLGRMKRMGQEVALRLLFLEWTKQKLSPDGIRQLLKKEVQA